MSMVSHTRILVEYELCKCKYRLHGNVCHLNKKWDHDKCCANIKNLLIGVLFKKAMFGILVHIMRV